VKRLCLEHSKKLTFFFLKKRRRVQWMNDRLVTYIDNDIFKIINNKEIMQRFQNIKIHRGQLNKLTLEIFLINYYSTLFFNLDPPN
jgi:hypothetical protein